MAMRPKTRTPRPPAKPWEPTAAQRAAGLYYEELIAQYRGAPPEWYVVAQAVRLYIRRVNGFDTFLHLLMKFGVPMIAERCCHEMTVRQEFMANMIAWMPPEDPAVAEGCIEEMADDLAVLHSRHGSERLLRFLDRIRMREQTLQAKPRTVH
jgi:hypothetical protein